MRRGVLRRGVNGVAVILACIAGFGGASSFATPRLDAPANDAIPAGGAVPILTRLLVRPVPMSSYLEQGLTVGEATARRNAAQARLGARIGMGATGGSGMAGRARAAEIGMIEPLGISIVRPPAGRDPLAWARELLASGDYDLVEFDQEVSSARGGTTPNDPLYATQWHLAKIGAPIAWSITQGSPDVVVAICDSGIDLDHPDLTSLLVPGYNAVDHLAQAQGGQVDGLTNHGTEVAGCVAAVTDNATGIAGLGWNLRLMPVRVSNTPNDTAFLSDIMNGAMWAADHGARVVNVSFSSVESETASLTGAYVRSKGATLTWAAGNSAISLGLLDPPDIFVVGATTQSDTLAPFSNSGAALDVVAPGVAITTTSLGGYSAPAGTSFATPIVSGGLGLVRSANPSLSAAAAEYLVKSTSTDLGLPGEDEIFGAGRLDVGAAVSLAHLAATQQLPPIAEPDATWSLEGAGVVVVAPMANDLDLNGDSIALVSWTQPAAHGTVTLGTPTPDGSPTLEYETIDCFEGIETFEYTIADPSGDQDSASVTVSTVRAPEYFPQSTPMTPGFAVPSSLEAGDIDDDGDVDLVAVYIDPLAAINVFLRGPNGFDQVLTLDASEFSSIQVRIGRIAGTPRPDLVAVEQLANRLVVYPGLDSGGFGPGVVTTVSQPTAVAAADTNGVPFDANGDGFTDLVVATGGFPAQVRILFGAGNGTFTIGPALETPTHAMRLLLADLTGDGHDEVVALIDGTGEVRVMSIGAGGALALLSTQASNATPSDLAVGDVDGDGDLDVAVGGSTLLGLPGGVRLLRNNGSGQLLAPELITASNVTASGIALADLDGDGDIDLATTQQQVHSLAIHPGVPATFESGIAPIARVVDTITNPTDLVAFDDDGDGDIDLATIMPSVNGQKIVRVFRCESPAAALFDADLNGDGVIGAADVGLLLGAWGTANADLDGNGTTDAADLAKLLGYWDRSVC